MIGPDRAPLLDQISQPVQKRWIRKERTHEAFYSNEKLLGTSASLLVASCF